jgi:hypothetical protein
VSFSDYIVYVDESGDHGLAQINPEYPVFVLAFCIVRKDAFASTIVPSFQALKFEFWGHDGVVLHSHDIRKARGDFRILQNSETRSRFMTRLNGVIAHAEFTVIAAAINKIDHVRRYAYPANPYSIAMAFCTERLQRFLEERGQMEPATFLLVEGRGHREDAGLELEFRRICDGENAYGPMPNLKLRFMDKKHNSTGLQLADLVAHPIGRHLVKPEQPNRAFDIVERKLRRSASGTVRGYGLKVFP